MLDDILKQGYKQNNIIHFACGKIANAKNKKCIFYYTDDNTVERGILRYNYTIRQHCIKCNDIDCLKLCIYLLNQSTVTMMIYNSKDMTDRYKTITELQYIF